MKFLILIAIVVAIAAVAEEIRGPYSMGRELDHLTADLHLSDTQQNEIQPLLEANHDRIEALLDRNPTLSRTDLEPQIHAISQQTHQQIDALLSPAQLAVAKRREPRY